MLCWFGFCKRQAPSFWYTYSASAPQTGAEQPLPAPVSGSLGQPTHLRLRCQVSCTHVQDEPAGRARPCALACGHWPAVAAQAFSSECPRDLFLRAALWRSSARGRTPGLQGSASCFADASCSTRAMKSSIISSLTAAALAAASLAFAFASAMASA